MNTVTSHLLHRTKCYLAGNIENSNAPSSWRDQVKTELRETGILFFDPLKKPFLDSVNENKEHIARMVKLREEGRFDELARIMRKIRVEDLSLVDRADFLIASISARTASWGTAEEVFWANRMKKPIFLVVAEGRRSGAQRLEDLDLHRRVGDVILAEIKQIDAGEKKIDLTRWKIFREEFR